MDKSPWFMNKPCSFVRRTNIRLGLCAYFAVAALAWCNDKLYRAVAPVDVAYEALQQADADSAQQLYQQQLQRYPDDRQALLGLAAVALLRQQHTQAWQYYQQLLTVYPEDDIAYATLVSLGLFNDLVEAESQLQQALTKQASAPLASTLATLLSSQQRWYESHRYYLQAYQLQPHHADCVYNLAVSFDHLGQHHYAKHYYQLALQLAKPIHRLPQAQVRQRLEQLHDA